MLNRTLHTAILDLAHTGATGFEGLVRDLFSQIAGQPFRVMKSGPQGGVDILSDLRSNNLHIGVEGKHYKENTRLGLDELKAKLLEATEQQPPLDIWVLATTREIAANDAKALIAIGTSYGIDVLILDWPECGGKLPLLAVACAMAPQVMELHLGSVKNIQTDLTEIQQHPEFARESNELSDRLRSPLAGYIATREKVKHWLHEQMRSTNAARYSLNSHAALEEPGAHRIARPILAAALDAWWQHRPENAVLLGEEGAGKTWMALSWWMKSIESDEFPLTVAISSRDVEDSDGPTAVARALVRQTKQGTTEYWLQRLNRWMSVQSKRPFLLLIVDGLNQKWAFAGWSDFLLSLAQESWNGKCVVLMTCRPDHFRSKLKELAGLRRPIAMITVTLFNDEELDALLALYGVAREEFSKEMIPLLKVPRLSHLAISMRNELRESGDVTVERLVYEDWKNRSSEALKVMSHAEFKNFIRSLGLHVKQAQAPEGLTRADLLGRMREESGDSTSNYEVILSEIVDGRWLEATDQPNRYRVRKEMLPHVLGLSLFGQLKNIEDFEHGAERIAAMIDDLQGQDLAVAILRAASTFALLEANVPKVVKLVLLSTWLQAQNFGPLDFEAFWRCIGCDPETVLDTAERLWFSDARRSSDEALVKGFANAWRWTNVQSAGEARLTQWLSQYWLDPYVGEVLGIVPNDESAKSRREETLYRVKEWLSDGADCGFDIALQESDPKGQARGSYRAIEMMSWLPRATLIRPLTAWALTRALMNLPGQNTKFAWVLRWNEIDPEEMRSQLLRRAEELIQTGLPLQQKAAELLLAALATSRDIEQYSISAPSSPLAPAASRVEAEWDIDYAMSFERVKNSPLDAVILLKGQPEDPACHLDAQLSARLVQIAEKVTDAQLVEQNIGRDGGLSRARAALARWSPQALVDLERRRMHLHLPMERSFEDFRASTDSASSSLPRAPASLEADIQKMLLAVPEEDLQQWKQAARVQRHSLEPWDIVLQATALAGETAAEQIAILAQAPQGQKFWDGWELLLAPLDEESADLASRHLQNASSTDSIQFWLMYCDATSDLGNFRARFPLESLYAHADRQLAALAMQVAFNLGSRELADALASSGWSWKHSADSNETAYGSMLLTRADLRRWPDLPDRIYPQALGALVLQNPDEKELLRRFAHYIRDELGLLATARSYSYPRYRLHSAPGMELVARDYCAELESWLEPFITGQARDVASTFAVAERFPLLQALEAIEPYKPGRWGAFVVSSLEDHQRFIVRLGDLTSEAFKLPDPQGERARQIVLEGITNDSDLLDFAIRLQKGEQSSEKLLRQIHRDLDHVTAGVIARGLCLAGFLNRSPEADALWNGRLLHAPANGWLEQVHLRAVECYRRNAWREHWQHQFLSSQSEADALCALELYIASVDSRARQRNALPSPETVQALSWRRRAAWTANPKAANKVIKKQNDALKKLFLGEAPPLPNQHPARR